MLHPQELSDALRQGYQRFLLLSHKNFDYHLSWIHRYFLLPFPKHNHPDNVHLYNNHNDDAIIHFISIPDSCRTNSNKCQDDNIISNLLSTQLKEAFQSDGVIALRGIFTQEEIQRLKQASHEYIQNNTNSSTHRSGSAKQFFLSKYSIALQQEDFRYIALQSMLPRIVAELLWEYNDLPQRQNHKEEKEGANNTTIHHFTSSTLPSSIRMIRDVLLVKDQDPYICGWHVDDVGFWPATYDSPGINAWIAIDDMDRETGGGFALSVGSHRVPWRFDAYNLTGATYTLPEHGYLDAEDMFRQRNAGTCNIKNVAPEFHTMLEERKRIYSVQAGDVIFHTRWLFHRTVPFTAEFIKSRGFLQNQNDQILYRRYSVRYSPSDAILPEGFGTEPSKLYDDENKGTLEDIMNRGDAWYPKCWPNVEDKELDNILNELPAKIAVAEKRQKEVMKEMRPYLQTIGKHMSRNRLNSVIQKSLHPEDSSISSVARTSGIGEL
jgi:ectoine hydroxylase-related dioxygenase (phytanoyl-CoA dioxygenase family)